MLTLAVIVTEVMVLSIVYGLTGVRSFVLTNLAIVLASFALVADLLSKRNRKLAPYIEGLVCAYLIRLFFLYFDLYGRSIYALPNSGIDSEKFWRNALLCAEGLDSIGGAFVELLGTIIILIGENRLFVQYVLMLCSMATLFMLARSLSELGGSKPAGRRAFGLLCVMPNYAILSSILLRESIVCMCATAALSLFLCWIRTKMEPYFAGAVAAVLVGSMFHSGIVAIAAAFVIVRIVYDNKSGTFRISATNVVFALVCAGVLYYLYSNYGDRFFAKFGTIDSVDDIASGADRGASSYARYVGDSSSAARMALFTLPRMAYFSFSPFPWQWRGLKDVITSLFDSLFYVVSAYKAWKALRSDFRHVPPERVLECMIVAVLMVTMFVFGWGTSNVGTAIRHRAKVLPWFAMQWAVADCILGHELGRQAGNRRGNIKRNTSKDPIAGVHTQRSVGARLTRTR